MPKKANLEPKTRTIRVPQKNGDIYVYERITKYNPEKHYNEVIKSRLITIIHRITDMYYRYQPNSYSC